MRGDDELEGEHVAIITVNPDPVSESINSIVNLLHHMTVECMY